MEKVLKVLIVCVSSNFFLIIIINIALETQKIKEKFFKEKVKIKNIKKNDMIFWKGHVAIVLSKSKLLHAYGPTKKSLLWI